MGRQKAGVKRIRWGATAGQANRKANVASGSIVLATPLVFSSRHGMKSALP
jgi:hypothetical protein